MNDLTEDPHSTVEGIGVNNPYVNRFTLWNPAGNFKTGDKVGAVGVAVTYSVQLRTIPGEKKAWLQVHDGHIVNAIALQALMDKSVFAPEGRYLGQGGGELEPLPDVDAPRPVPLLESLIARTPKPEAPQKDFKQILAETQKLAAKLPGPAFVAHTFHLRPDFEVVIALPEDLTEHETTRLGQWVKLLPFPDLS